jgi:hypothetical protein
MPAVASLEDLKAARKEGSGIYAMLYALCSMLYEDGVALVGRMCVEPPWERVEPFKGWVGATSRPQANGLLCRGKLWLEERTPEQLKGEGG